MDLGRVDRITHIMAFTVCNVCDQAFRFAKFFADDLNDINVCHFIVSADVVNFSNTSFVDDQVDCAAMIFYIEPVTNVFACSVYRKWFVI